MNKHVRELVAEALRAEGVEKIFTIGEEQAECIDIFDDEYMERVLKLKLPHTKIQLLQKLLGKAISDFKKVNQLKGVDFSKRWWTNTTSAEKVTNYEVKSSSHSWMRCLTALSKR